jgi:hypothetical protein
LKVQYIVYSLILSYTFFSCKERERRSEKDRQEGLLPIKEQFNKEDISGRKPIYKTFLKLFIHKTNSMNGFRFVGASFGDGIHSFINNMADPQNKLISGVETYSVETEIEPIIQPLGGGVNKLADYIDQTKGIDGNNTNHLKPNNKNYSKIFETLLKHGIGKEGQIAGFISDLVYYPGAINPNQLRAYLNGQGERIKTTFQAALSQSPDLCIILLKGYSNYKWDKKVSNARPYYILFFGKKKDLQPIMGFSQKNWRGNYFWFELTHRTLKPKVVVARGHNWAKGSYDTDHRNENLIKEPIRRGNNPFSFVSEVDLNEFKGLEYLVTEPSRYKGSEWKVSKIGKDPTYTPNIHNAYQFEIMSNSDLKPSEFELRIPYSSPTWIKQSSHSEYPCGLISDPKYAGRTFGFETLIKGIIDAYHIGETDLLQLNYRITK